MRDPFVPVLKCLHSLFQLETTRNGKFTFREIQHLKETTDIYYQNPSKYNFIQLKKAIRNSLGHIEKWKLNFEAIKHSLDEIAQLHGMPPINWTKLLAHSPTSPKFQFSALNHVGHEGLLSWLTAKAGLSRTLTHAELTQLLVEHKKEPGFSKKLSHHLENNPAFLFDLIMKSEESFNKIVQTLLVLYLTDEQLAAAIIKHHQEPPQEEITFEYVNSVIEKCNQTLSSGRSISTLLRNSNAKAILDKSVLFQIYQSDEYVHQDEYAVKPLAHSEGHRLKPGFH